MKFSLEFVACFCTAIFAGAALYISLVEHPARMECGPALATVEFGPSYRRATVMQASLAVVAFLAATGAWWLHAGRVWLVGGVLIGAVAPFTLLVIFPTNKKLLDPSLDRNSEMAKRLLQKWGRLHGVRTALSLAALVIMLWAGTAAARMHPSEQTLRQDLFTLRNVIDQYTLDKQEAPHSLDDLVKAGYLKSIPVDPCTGRADWVLVMEHSPGTAPGIVDLDSAARLKSFDESGCSDW